SWPRRSRAIPVPEPWGSSPCAPQPLRHVTVGLFLTRVQPFDPVPNRNEWIQARRGWKGLGYFTKGYVPSCNRWNKRPIHNKSPSAGAVHGARIAPGSQSEGTMVHKHILYGVESGVATVTLNRPDRLNAWTGTMHHEVKQAMRDASADESVRVIVLTGAGR